MATGVSSLLDYIIKNPTASFSFGQVEHELQHVKIRERMSTFITVASTALLILAAASIIGGGTFVIGALVAIAVVGALYTVAAREAESSLRSKQVVWMQGKEGSKEGKAEGAAAPVNQGFLDLGWFSKSPK